MTAANKDFNDWSTTTNEGDADQAEQVVRKARKVTQVKEYGSTTFYMTIHIIATVGAVAATTEIGRRWYKTFKKTSEFAQAIPGNSNRTDLLFQLYVPSIVMIIAAGRTVFEIINTMAKSQGTFERAFFVPEKALDTASSPELVKIVAFVNDGLLDTINDTKLRSSEKQRLDVEAFNKTRDIQTASAQYGALIADCARGVDSVLSALAPVQSTPGAAHSASTSTFYSVSAITVAYEAMLLAETELITTFVSLGLAKNHLTTQSHQAWYSGKEGRVANAYAKMEIEQPTDSSDEEKKKSAYNLVDDLTGLQKWVPDRHVGDENLQYGAFLPGGSVDKKGKEYLTNVKSFESELAKLTAYLASMRLDSGSVSPGVGASYAANVADIEFVGSPTRLLDRIVAITSVAKLEGTPNGFTMSVFQDKGGDERKDTAMLTRVAWSLAGHLKDEERKRQKWQAWRWGILEGALWAIAGITFVRYTSEFITAVPEKTKENDDATDCRRAVALRHDMDLTVALDESREERKKAVDDLIKRKLSDDSNHKLRADYFHCMFQKRLVHTRDRLIFGTKVTLSVLVLCLVGAALRSHFNDLRTGMDSDYEDLNTITSKLGAIYAAIKVDSNVTDRSGVDKAVDDLVAARDRCKLLRSGNSSTGKTLVLGQAAKYGLAAAFALTAVLVALQTARPGDQVQRMKELGEWKKEAKREGVVTGGGPNRQDLLLELERLQSEGSPVEMQIVVLCVLLAASAYACVALGTEVVMSIPT